MIKYYDTKTVQSESQKHHMNLLCMGEKKLLRWIKKYPSDGIAHRVRDLRGLDNK